MCKVIECTKDSDCLPSKVCNDDFECVDPPEESTTPPGPGPTTPPASTVPTLSGGTPIEPEVIRLENPIFKLGEDGEQLKKGDEFIDEFGNKRKFASGDIGANDISGGERDLLLVLVRITKKALGYIGGVALLVFIYGGFMWLVSAGNAERIKSGTETMMWALVGLFIIFSSYAILDLIINTLTGK